MAARLDVREAHHEAWTDKPWRTGRGRSRANAGMWGRAGVWDIDVCVFLGGREASLLSGLSGRKTSSVVLSGCKNRTVSLLH